MLATPFARTGGPSRSGGSSHDNYFGVERDVMPQMPLDTTIHWDWRNPLNIIPACVMSIIVIDLISLFM